MNTERKFDDGVAPRLRPDFAERVVRQARLVQRRRRERRRAVLGAGVLMALLLGGMSLFSGSRWHPRRDSISPAVVDSLDFGDVAPLTADTVLSTLEYSGERGDDPAAYFFPDSETLASASA
jgi:hypothetical protein